MEGSGIDALICCGYYRIPWMKRKLPMVNIPSHSSAQEGSLAHAGHSPGGIKGKRDNHT